MELRPADAHDPLVGLDVERRDDDRSALRRAGEVGEKDPAGDVEVDDFRADSDRPSLDHRPESSRYWVVLVQRLALD